MCPLSDTELDSATSPVIAIIPARYASTRFPGKPLANETGKPLIQHVYEQAQASTRVSRVIVATNDQKIHDAVVQFGGEVQMTRTDHPNGTSRLAEVVQNLFPSETEDPIVVNVQGDEPELDPKSIDLAVKTLIEKQTDIATLAAPITEQADHENPNVVKVVLDQNGHALYFSRSPIPYKRSDTDHAPLRHVGLYVYRRSFLLRYITLPPTPLEQIEQLEQLRVLEHNGSIAVAIVPHHHDGIDTPEQYTEFVKRHNHT